jgi:hypothetical protein
LCFQYRILISTTTCFDSNESSSGVLHKRKLIGMGNPGREADHLLPYGVEVRGAIPPLHIRLHAEQVALDSY